MFCALAFKARNYKKDILFLKYKINKMGKKFKPKGIQTLVPFLFLKDIPEFVDFVKNELDATIVAETKTDKGITYYATIKFDDTTMFVQEIGESKTKVTGSLYLYVPDIDATYNKLLKTGATSISEPETYYHGDRFAVVKDKWDNTWYIATANEELEQSEVQNRRKDDER